MSELINERQEAEGAIQKCNEYIGEGKMKSATNDAMRVEGEHYD